MQLWAITESCSWAVSYTHLDVYKRQAPTYQEGAPAIYRVASMEEAVETAHRIAKAGDIVSMSPASASFDLYPNFEARGNHFKQLVNDLQ